VHSTSFAAARARQATVPEGSGWTDKTSDGKGGQIDRLHDLGQAQNYNINVDHGAHAALFMLCFLFFPVSPACPIRI
jgi:hypothetical protein